MVSTIRNTNTDKTYLLHKETIRIIKAKILLGLKEFTVDIPGSTFQDWRGETAINLAKLGVQNIAFSNNPDRNSMIMHIFMK